jgi:hypothetical protein
MGNGFTSRCFAWLAILIVAATMATCPAWAEPVRLSAAEADQITAGSFDDSWLGDTNLDYLLVSLNGGGLKIVKEGDTLVIGPGDLQSGTLVMGGTIEIGATTSVINSTAIVIK